MGGLVGGWVGRCFLTIVSSELSAHFVDFQSFDAIAGIDLGVPGSFFLGCMKGLLVALV